MSEKGVYDAIIVGAGVSGVSTAYYLQQENPSWKILLLDRQKRAGLGNTSKSVALFRDAFGSELNRDLAGSTIKFFDHVERDLDFSLNVKRMGYYWMMNHKQRDSLKSAISNMMSNGIDLECHDKEEVRKRFGGSESLLHLSPDPDNIKAAEIDCGLFAHNGGSLSPSRLTAFYVQGFIAAGGEVEYNFEVEKLLVGPFGSGNRSPGDNLNVWDTAVVYGVKGSNEETRRCHQIVIASGVWSPSLLDPVGIDCFVKPKTRQAFGLAGPTARNVHDQCAKNFETKMLPAVVLPVAGVYLKPLHGQKSFVVGCAEKWRPFELDPKPVPDVEGFLNGQIRPVVNAYYPSLRNCTVNVKWAGQYHICTLDGNPVIFKDSNITIATGASGSGIMKSDAIGRIASACLNNRPEVELYGGKTFKTSSCGVYNRSAEHETFVI